MPSKLEQEFLNIIRYHPDILKVKKLLKKGVNINATSGSDNYSALLYAQENGDANMCKFLLNAGINPNIQENYQGFTALLFECLDGHDYGFIKALLKHGANPNIINYEGYTPLNMECSNNASNVVIKMLLDAGASIDIKAKDGYTALFNAVDCRYKRVNSVKLLLDHGADPNVQNLENDTPLISACRYKKQYYDEYSEDSEDLKDSEDLEKCSEESSIYSGLEESSVFTDIESTNSAESVELNEKNEKIIDLLLSKGANPNLQNNYLQTALHVAIDNYNPSIYVIKELIKYKADPNIKDWRGRTAKEYADFYGYTEIYDLIKNI